MSTRHCIQPEPRFAELKSTLQERMARIAAGLQPDHFEEFLDPLMHETLRRGFQEAGAHEGTVWLVDAAGEYLVPAYNTGPDAAAIVGKFRQPLNAGLICMVFACEQPFVENEVHKNTRQSKLLDATLGVQTYSLIAVPFYFLKACRGVVSCVQLKKLGGTEGDPPGFSPESLASVVRATALLSRLIEYTMISRTIGWQFE